jgi:hypothetical protein
MVGADPPSQSEATVHSTEAVQSPVPSAWTGDKSVNPERPPAGVFGELVMLVIVEPLKLSLNRKSSPPPAPVSTNLFPLFSTTSKRTDVPLCVSVTVPNDVAVPHPPERWHDVKVKVSARLATVVIPNKPILKPSTDNALALRIAASCTCPGFTERIKVQIK